MSYFVKQFLFLFQCLHDWLRKIPFMWQENIHFYTMAECKNMQNALIVISVYSGIATIVFLVVLVFIYKSKKVSKFAKEIFWGLRNYNFPFRDVKDTNIYS